MDEGRDFDYSIFEENFSLPLHDIESKTKEQLLLIATIHFAKNGYANVTMRDIAKIAGIQQSSIYNHFESKEDLWRQVIKHASNLYMLYFEQLDRRLARADTFEEVLEMIFQEPRKMRNIFTCYAFSMVQAEQFRDDSARSVFCDTFLNYSIEFFQGWFDKCVARGMAQPFDTRTVASIIMNSTLVGIEVSVHKIHEHSTMALYDPREMLAGVQRFILQSVAPTQSVEAV